jgi:hypothetical protein
MRTKMLLIPILAAVALVCLCWWAASAASAEAPTVIQYRARLTDTVGNPVNATLPMTFALYAAPSGVPAAWIEPHANVTVLNGIVTAYLGEVTPLSSAVLNGNSYLGVTVGSDSEMTPRQRLGSVPYARTLAAGAHVAGSSSTALVVVSNTLGGPPGPGLVSHGNPGLQAWSTAGAAAIAGHNDSTSGFGVFGTSLNHTAVAGYAGLAGGQPGSGTNLALKKAGIAGCSTIGPGGYFTATNAGLYATSLDGPAFKAELHISGHGTHGFNHTVIAGGGGVPGFSAIVGSGGQGPGVYGRSMEGSGMVGEANQSGDMPLTDAVRDISFSTRAGVLGYSPVGPGIFAWSTLTHSLVVSGSARVTGDLLVGGDVITNADVAEHYVAVGPLEAGDVVVLDPATALGVRRADQAYDATVAGVISSDPAIVLPGAVDGVPLALVGRVPAKADASFGPIGVGDLLTTSPTPGHAMRCADRLQCIGAVIGKALQPLHGDTGIILVLVALN